MLIINFPISIPISAVMYSRDDIVSWLVARKSTVSMAAGPMQQTCLHLASARHSGHSLQVISCHVMGQNVSVYFIVLLIIRQSLHELQLFITLKLLLHLHFLWALFKMSLFPDCQGFVASLISRAEVGRGLVWQHSVILCN